MIDSTIQHNVAQIDLMFRGTLNKTMAARLAWEGCDDRKCLDHLEAVRTYIDTIVNIVTKRT